LDEGGTPVSKTRWGKRFGKTLSREFKDRRSAKSLRCVMVSDTPTTVLASPLLLKECFNITKAGKYQLKFEMHAVQETGMKAPDKLYVFHVDVQIPVDNP
jgi:hypothetical protein